MRINVKFAAVMVGFAAVASVPARAVVITFDGLTGGTVAPNGAISYPSPVVTDGYIFTTLPFADGRPAQFATWTAASNVNASFSNYTGSISLFSNSGSPSTMRASTGGPFSVSSLSVGYLYRPAGAIAITFTGILAGGGSVTQTYTTPGDALLHTVNLTGFTGLSSLTLSQVNGNEALQFDNINAVAVPEPASACLLGVGVLALCAARRRLGGAAASTAQLPF